MHLNTILSADRTFAKQEITSKKKATEFLANIFSNSNPDINETKLLKKLINREKLGSTGIGEGIAIPHCRIEGLVQPCAACITFNNPINFDAIDHKPVDLILAILVPEDSEQEHLEILASLAQKFQTKDFASNMRSATDNVSLYEITVS